MHVLQRGLIVVLNRKFIGSVHQMGVVDSRVSNVVRNARNQKRQNVLVVQKGTSGDPRAAVREREVGELVDLDRVLPVVVTVLDVLRSDGFDPRRDNDFVEMV